MNGPVLVEKDAQVGSDTNLENWLENVSPRKLLSTVSPNYPSEYLDRINDIYQALADKLPTVVINCMIFKTVRDKGGDLPTVSYFIKVAEAWLSDSVLSTKDAIKYITSVKEKTIYKKKENEFTSNADEEIVWEEL